MIDTLVDRTDVCRFCVSQVEWVHTAEKAFKRPTSTMRFPIRYQILLPVSLVMMSLVAGSVMIVSKLSQQAAEDRIKRRIDSVMLILERSTFPLTDNVLKQMAGLAGAQFTLVRSSGEVVGASEPTLSTAAFSTANVGDSTGLGQIRRVNNRQYYHRVLPLNRNPQEGELRLHAFFPAAEYRRIWRRAAMPSLIVALAALAAASACAFWVGGSVSRSANAIVKQLRCISAGQFQPRLQRRSNDELGDIADELNRAARLLEQYESDVRDGERMKTMVAMGAGLAHQIRNSVTGCRMALDIHADESQSNDNESMQVARRQLTLMENYLQRFLLLAKVESNRSEPESFDITEAVDQAVSLVRYSASHLGVDLAWEAPKTSFHIVGDLIAVEQSIVNLVLNAIEAATAAVTIGRGANDGVSSDPPAACVHIELQSSGVDQVRIVVRDNGEGPSEGLDVFAPFVTGKKSGVGLGLAVVKEVAREHGGEATWTRQDDWTEFVMQLPLETEAD